MNIGNAGMASPTLASTPQTKIGVRFQVIPRARMVRIVVVMLAPAIAAGDREDDDRHEVGVHARRRLVRQRGVPDPARRDAAEERSREQHRQHRDQQPQAERVQPRERHVPRADHDRHDEVPERAGDHDDRREDHGQAVQADDASCRSAGRGSRSSG